MGSRARVRVRVRALTLALSLAPVTWSIRFCIFWWLSTAISCRPWT